MEEKNNNNKKKIILVLIAVLTILLVIGGATYAFYTVQVNNSSTQTNFNTNTEVVGNATLKMLTDNLHINVTAQDMAEGNKGNDYYGTKDATKGYEKEQEKATYNLVEVDMKDGGSTTKYVCSATIKVSVEGEMVSGLKAKDLILSLNGGNLEEELDIYSIKETREKSYDVNFNIEGNTTHTISGYLKLSNRDDDQTNLANKSLNVKLNSTKIECNVVTEFPKEPETLVTICNDYTNMSTCMTNKKSDILELDNIAEVGGMYRYQGTDNVNNWICFGADEETCNKASTDDTVVDKYMYRIIGVTESGQLKLIKETFVKEGTENSFAWHNKSTIPDCGTQAQGGTKCAWKRTRLFNRLNGYCGTSKDLSYTGNSCTGENLGTYGDSNIFIGNSEYEYLVNNSPWLNKIADHEWKYGDAGWTSTRTLNDFDTEAIYAIESSFTDKVTARIGLMFAYDYHFAFQVEGQLNKNNALTSWLHFKKDGYNTAMNKEYLQTREAEHDNAWWVCFSSEDGGLPCGYGGYLSGVRPVFYLKETIQIINGIGSKTQPYIIQQ